MMILLSSSMRFPLGTLAVSWTILALVPLPLAGVGHVAYSPFFGQLPQCRDAVILLLVSLQGWGLFPNRDIDLQRLLGIGFIAAPFDAIAPQDGSIRAHEYPIIPFSRPGSSAEDAQISRRSNTPALISFRSRLKTLRGRSFHLRKQAKPERNDPYVQSPC